MNLREMFRINKRLSLSINSPLVSEGVILTNFYEELQKNSWSDLIEDDTKDLTQLISVIATIED